MRLLIAAAVVALLAGCAGKPMPPPETPTLAEWPAWSVGDAWSWSVTSRGSDGAASRGNVSGEVVEERADVYVVVTRDNQGHEDTYEFWKSNRTRVGETTGVRFPLVEGANWTDGRHAWRVVAFERVSTPLGDYDAWHFNVTSGKVWRDEWWAPEAKIWVKAYQVASFQGVTVTVERMIQEVRLASP